MDFAHLILSFLSQCVITILSECGGDVDEAIKRLGHLSLAKAQQNEPSQDMSQDAMHEQPLPATHRHASSDQPLPPSTSPRDSSAAQEARPSDPSQPQPPSSSYPSHESSSNQEGATGGSQQGGAAPNPTPTNLPRNPEEWVEGLVSEMASARDMVDARSRAVKILSSFEGFVLDHSSSTGPRAGQGAGEGAGAGAASMLRANEELLKENSILKRAVQIQNQKLIERAQAHEAQVSHQEAEMAHLRGAVAHQQEQIRQLEMSNYSLAIHLQRAEQGGPMGSHRHPDVF